MKKDPEPEVLVRVRLDLRKLIENEADEMIEVKRIVRE